MKTEQEKLKRQIVKLIKRSGLPVGTQYIAEHVTLPEDIDLDDLLTELVVEKRLHRSYTLLSNGDPERTYI